MSRSEGASKLAAPCAASCSVLTAPCSWGQLLGAGAGPRVTGPAPTAGGGRSTRSEESEGAAAEEGGGAQREPALQWPDEEG